MKVEKAVIPVAGFGTRFLPVTKVVPKELLPIVDKPTIHYIIEEAYKSGIRQIIFVTASGKHGVEDYFDVSLGLEAFLTEKLDKEKDKKKKEEIKGLLDIVQEISDMIEIHAVRQKVPRGLGHAIYTAHNFIGNEPFAVLLGDDIIDSKVPVTKQMIRVAKKYSRGVVAVCRVPKDKASKYGIIEPKPIDQRVNKVKTMVEKPKRPRSNLAIIGRYILPPEIFGILEKTKPGKNGEIQITDALKTLNGKRGKGIIAYEFEGTRYDAGEIFGFIEANIAYAMKHPELREKLITLARERLINEE